MPVGRPTIMCPIMQDAVCLALSQGLTIRQIDQHPSLPGKDAIFKLLRDDPNGVFAERYRRAREEGIDALVDETLQIADDASRDELPDGRIDHEHIQRAKLRVETRRWIAAKRAPKKYGDKLDVTSSDGSMTPARGLNDFYNDQQPAGDA